MPLGGGTFLVQNKKLPGSYINFVSKATASATLSDRGVVTLPLELDWGPDDEVFTVENGDFLKNSMKYFGYDYTSDKLKGLRDVFMNAVTLHAYRLNGGGTKEAYGDTASRDFLILRCKERGITPRPATYAVLKGVFTPATVDVVGKRFSLETANFVVTEKIADGEYQVRCEESGTGGNQFLGSIIPIDYVDGLISAELVEVLIPGENEEDTEDLRERYSKGHASHAEGQGTSSGNFASHAGGKYNKTMTEGGNYNNITGDVFAIGNGTGYTARSNAFRVTYAGETYGLTSFKTSGADYAEYFEWQDGNPQAEDRVGRFVTMSGKHIKTAAPGDYILGVVSGQPCIIGNADEDWLGRWEHDDFGRFVKRYMVEDKTEIDPPADEKARMELLHDPQVREENGRWYRLTPRFVDYETPSWDYKPNPDYDSSQPYIERRDRKEWDAVGMLGVLPVWDDGSCQVDGWCQPGENGTATAAESYIPGQTYRVIERVSENVVKIVFR